MDQSKLGKAAEFFGIEFNKEEVASPPVEQKPTESRGKAFEFFGKDFGSPKPVEAAIEARRPLPEPVSKAPSIESLFDKLIKAESGGKHIDEKGNLITSQAGAEGITQLMPKTAKNPGFGIEPVKDKSEAEYMRVGKEYLQALMNKFGGDAEKALAAYNWGVGKVSTAIGKAERFGEDWKNALPEETKNYLNKILGVKKSSPSVVPERKNSPLRGDKSAFSGGLTPEDVKRGVTELASMTPVIGDVMSIIEGYQGYREGDPVKMASGAIGALPFIAAGTARKALTTNYMRQIENEVPTLYRETNGSGFLDMFSGSHPFGPPRQHYAEIPEMALGQGSNRGLRFEIETKGLTGKVNRDKPALDQAYMNGAGEFIIQNQPSEILNNLKSVEVTPKAYEGLSKGETRRLDMTLKQLESKGIIINKVGF